MTHLARVASLIYNRPLLVHPNTADVVNAALGERFGTDGRIDLSGLQPDASRFRGTATDTGARYRVEAGTAIITVTGELCNRGAWMGASSGLTSYEGIAAQLRAALADPAVDSMVLDLDTPGGEAVGAFECAAAVAAAARQKPVTAFVDGMAASAGYALASGADRIVVTPSAIVGSIGVVMMHLDQSKRMERAGVAVTLIFAGDHKVDGHSFGPLPDGVKADLKAEVDGFYAMFVDTVASNRGMDADAVRATQARCFMGEDGIAAGLADEIGSLDTILASFQRARTATGPIAGLTMDATISRADHDKALATARNEAFSTGIAAGKTEGAAALATAQAAVESARADGIRSERARIGAILGSEDAKGREATASYLALKTDMSAEAAVAMMAGMPAGASAGTRMGAVPNPAVTPDAGSEPKAFDAAAAWGGIMDKVTKEGAPRF